MEAARRREGRSGVQAVATVAHLSQCIAHGVSCRMSDNQDRIVTGRCLCGDIRYEYRGAPVKILHCHCESCRRHTSSPVATFVCVPQENFRWLSGTPVAYASSPGVTRTHCGRCGAPLTYASTPQHAGRPLYRHARRSAGRRADLSRRMSRNSCRGSRPPTRCRATRAASRAATRRCAMGRAEPIEWPCSAARTLDATALATEDCPGRHKSGGTDRVRETRCRRSS